MTYATTIAASILIRSMLARVCESTLPEAITNLVQARTIAYFLTTICTGLVSYFTLKKSWKSGGQAASSGLPK